MFATVATLAALMVVVTPSTDLKKFEGEWYHVAMYTAAGELNACTRYRVSLGAACSCDGRPALALKFDMVSLPVVAVEEYGEVAAALERNCTSGGIRKTMAARLVNEEYFVLYESCYKCTETEPDTANLMARRLPTRRELDSLVGVEELKGRSGLTCNLIQ